MRTLDDHLEDGAAVVRGAAATAPAGEPQLVAVAARSAAHRRRARAGAGLATVAVLVLVGASLAVAGRADDSVLDVGRAADTTDAPTTGAPTTATRTSAETSPSTAPPTSATETTLAPSPGPGSVAAPTDPSTTVATPPSTTVASTTTTTGSPWTAVPPWVTTTLPPTATAPVPPHLPSEGEDPMTAYARWQADPPPRYRFRATWFQENNDVVTRSGPVDITVEGTGFSSKRVSVIDVATGEPVDSYLWRTIDQYYDVFTAEWRACPCLSAEVATGLPVDGVPAVLSIANTGTGQLFARMEISEFWSE